MTYKTLTMSAGGLTPLSAQQLQTIDNPLNFVAFLIEWKMNYFFFFWFQFVAHPNVQQLLASIWYEGLPGFRRKNMILQAMEIVRIGILFPFFSLMYIIAPHSKLGETMRKPFIKFICHSASYFTFLCKYAFHYHTRPQYYLGFYTKFRSGWLYFNRLYLNQEEQRHTNNHKKTQALF